MQERKLYTLEEKRQHVASWRASGLTRQQCCELHSIKSPRETRCPEASDDLLSGKFVMRVSL